MRKVLERQIPSSCLNKARDDEMLFVLLGRDAAAPVAIRAWIAERIRIGKNSARDPQIMDAERCAAQMVHDRLHAKSSESVKA